MTDNEKIEFCETMDHMKNALLGSYTIKQEIDDLIQTVSEADQKAIVLSCICLLRTVALLGDGRAKDAAGLAYGGIHEQAALYKNLGQDLATPEERLAAMKTVGQVQ